MAKPKINKPPESAASNQYGFRLTPQQLSRLRAVRGITGQGSSTTIMRLVDAYYDGLIDLPEDGLPRVTEAMRKKFPLHA